VIAAEQLEWREPIALARAWAEEPYAGLLLSDGVRGRWSYFVRAPDRVRIIEAGEACDLGGVLGELLGETETIEPDMPPFQGGVVGLAAYELGARLEPSAAASPAGEGTPAWPELVLARYRALLAFDHRERRLLAIGRGPDAAARARQARGWAEAAAQASRAGVPGRVASRPSPEAHMRAVEDVLQRIAAGEIFQANIARAWAGELAQGVTPFDAFERLAGLSPAPFAAYLRLQGRALVSSSPERFLSVDGAGLVSSEPIKGTRPRGGDVASDRRLAEELQASAKDRAENLMIVDLMRNDLSRVCAPGSVDAPVLMQLRSFANVHHLVSVVSGRLAEGRSAWDAFLAAFPPGSITGAPKVQAMQVIARHETARGPYCGSLFWAGHDGALDSSVLIRTLRFDRSDDGWRWEARGGGGVVADSDPAAETREAEQKVSLILEALEGPA
jgi:para-aminobenzoate synthetase component 1